MHCHHILDILALFQLNLGLADALQEVRHGGKGGVESEPKQRLIVWHLVLDLVPLFLQPLQSL